MTIFSGPRRHLAVRSLAAAATLALVSTLAAPATGADDGDDLGVRERDAKSQVRDAKGALQESSQQVTEAQRRLEAAEQRLSGARSRLGEAQADAAAAATYDAQMAAALQTAETQLVQARDDLRVAREKVDSQRGDIGRLAAAMYAGGDPQLMGLSVLLNSQDPAQATSQLNTATALMDRQTVTLGQLQDARAQLREQEARVEAAAERVSVQREEAAQVLARRQSLEAQARQAAGEVEALVGASEQARAGAVQVRAADQKALAEAEAQAAQVRQLIMERAARQQSGGFQGDSGGFLAQPVPGRVTSPFGYRIHPIYGYYGLHDGIDFGAPCGTANVAAAAGTVISRQYSTSYGNRLWLDLGRVNGKNLTVVYNHLSGYAVSSGQQVARGQVVGYTGSTGWSTGCHLHFTVLVDGTPVDPARYL